MHWQWSTLVSMKSHDTVVCAPSKLLARRPRVWFLADARIFLLSKIVHINNRVRSALWVSRTLSPAIQQLGHTVEHSSPSNAKVRNEKSCTSTYLYSPPHAFKMCTGTTLIYLLIISDIPSSNFSRPFNAEMNTLVLKKKWRKLAWWYSGRV